MIVRQISVIRNSLPCWVMQQISVIRNCLSNRVLEMWFLRKWSTTQFALWSCTTESEPTRPRKKKKHVVDKEAVPAWFFWFCDIHKCDQNFKFRPIHIQPWWFVYSTMWGLNNLALLSLVSTLPFWRNGYFSPFMSQKLTIKVPMSCWCSREMLNWS